MTQLARVSPWLCALAVCAYVIARRPWVPWADQLALLECSPLSGHYPGIQSGLVSCWVSGLANLLSPDGLIGRNIGLRLTAATLYLAGHCALAIQIVKSPWLQAALAALAVTTLHAFVWLSSELVVAATLCLALVACLKRWPSWMVGVALGLLAFSKPDLVVVSVALAIWAARQPEHRGSRWALLAAMAGASTLLILPGLSERGAAYLSGGNRSMHSLAQHAHILFSGRWQWLETQVAIEKYFPRADNLLDVIRLYPATYGQYVLLSVQRLWPGLRDALGPATYALPIVAAWVVTHPRRPGRYARLVGLSLVGVIPWVFLSLPHVRYFTRYVPALLCLLALTTLTIWRAPRSPERVAALGLLAGVFALTVSRGADAITEALGEPPHAVFWGAD